MAKVDIKHTCGHFETMFLYGNIEEKIEKKEKLTCAECYKKEQILKIANEIVKISKSGELVKLKGNEEEVKCAELIRAGAILRMQERIEKIKINRGEEVGGIVQRTTIPTVNRYPKAKFWIDNRVNIIGALNDSYTIEAIKLGIDKLY